MATGRGGATGVSGEEQGEAGSQAEQGSDRGPIQAQRPPNVQDRGSREHTWADVTPEGRQQRGR